MAHHLIEKWSKTPRPRQACQGQLLAGGRQYDIFDREAGIVSEWQPIETAPREGRVLAWFSCGSASAVAGIVAPAMYQLGYDNNNCIGCVKGGKGYWNKIRRDFPEAFDRMAKMERELDAAICKNEPVVNGKRTRQRVFLDELPPDAQDEFRFEMECGVLCQT